MQYAEIFKAAQRLTSKPVKFGTVTPELVAFAVQDEHHKDIPERIWAISEAFNQELHDLADARHPRPPSQTWRTFLTNHASQIMAADLFVVPTVMFRLLFVLVVLGHDRRRIVHVAVTAHPTAAWTAQQLRNAFPEDAAPTYLLHDRDAVFTDVATTTAGMNIQAVRTAPRSPWQRKPTWSASSGRSDVSASTMSSSSTRRGCSCAHRVHRLLHAIANASGTREGRADLAPGHAAVGRADRRHAASRRALPPLRSRGSLAVGRQSAHSRRRHRPVRRSRKCYSLSRVPRTSTKVNSGRQDGGVTVRTETQRGHDLARIGFSLATPSAARSCYNLGMRIASGKVVAGRVELDGELPEGASVTVGPRRRRDLRSRR